MPHLDCLSERFPDVPPTVLLKAELLRCGVRVHDASLSTHAARNHPSQGAESPLVQGSIELAGGVYTFLTPNGASPYVLQVGERGGLVLGVQTKRTIEPLADVKPGPRFRWTSARTSRGTPIASLFTPTLGGACGPLSVLLLGKCDLANHGEDCRFCSWVATRRGAELRPDVDDMREAITAIRQEQRTVGHLAFTGGSLFDRAKEADAYVSWIKAVKDTGVKLPTTVAALQALDRVDSLRLYSAGFDYACYAMDVWDRRAWQDVIPGKLRSVGRERWMACLKDAVDVFGSGRVLCNFVAGVETAAPHALRSIDEAVDSTLDGMRWCYQNGIYPKYSAWTPLPGSRWADKPPAPLDYYVQLMIGRQHLYREFDMRVPATDCQRCLTLSFEADLARLDPARYAPGAAGVYQWHKAHPPASSLDQLAA